MGKALKVFIQNKQPVNGVSFYRILQPMHILEDMDLIEILEDSFDIGTDDKIRAELIEQADVAFTHAVPATIMFRNYQGMLDVPPRFNPFERVVNYSAPWILDIDDAYDWISPTSPAFATWGVRDMEGNLVGDGGKIFAILQDGRQEILYEDGKPLAPGRGYKKGGMYSYRANIMRISKLKMALNSVSCVTTTTEDMKKSLLEEDRPKRVEVIPNCMARGAFPDIKPKKHRGVRILWQGGGAHYDDWALIRDAVVEVTKKYPNIVWVIFGQDYTPLLRGGGIKEKNIEYHKWVDFPAHKYELALLGCDINLAIIAPNLFSRGKSSIKWYEASALKYPICTLATDAPPYNREIEDGVTGLLYKNKTEFVEKLGQLIENAQLRRELADNAHEWVWENRDAEKWAPKLYDLFVELKETHIKGQGDLRELVGAVEGNLVEGNRVKDTHEEKDAVII